MSEQRNQLPIRVTQSGVIDEIAVCHYCGLYATDLIVTREHECELHDGDAVYNASVSRQSMTVTFVCDDCKRQASIDLSLEYGIASNITDTDPLTKAVWQYMMDNRSFTKT